MRRVRDLARRLAPPGARAALRRWRRELQGPPIFETELGAYRFVPDPEDRPRLTLVIPGVSRRTAFEIGRASCRERVFPVV